MVGQSKDDQTRSPFYFYILTCYFSSFTAVQI